MTHTPLPRQPLMRAPTLTLRLETGKVVLNTAQGKITFNDIALPLLDFFSVPHTIEEALAAFSRTGESAAHWMRVSSTVVSLHQAGALVSPEASAEAPPLVEGFAAAMVHVAMLNDRRRTSSYLRAIAETVRPGDVVVDLGTGTGILAMAAARAGARTVYAIEASAIAATAQALFDRNGLADRIQLLRGWSTEVTLPERANVLVTETLGTDPFDEGIADYVADARARFLTPDAQIIPQGLRVWALPVSIPQAHLDPRQFTPDAVARWSLDYGFDFSPLLSAATARPLHLQLPTALARTFPALSDAIEVANVDITQPFTSAIDTRHEFVANAEGRLNGVLIHFDVTLSPGVTFTTERHAAEDTNSWGHRILVLSHPIDVTPGDALSMRIDRLEGRLRAACQHRSRQPRQPRQQ